jgi:23S rRNA pseudouridine955/2504/2580 synthase
MQSIGKPVIGDPKYGDKTVNKRFLEEHGVSSQMLHAWKARFGGLGGRLAYLNGVEVTCEPEGYLSVLLSKKGD